jgi:uncharacterized protein YqjF (DUF2071 family)
MMHQKWRDLFFLHWECSPGLIQNTLPRGLYVDTFQERAFIGVVPFKVRDLRPSFFPSLPGISNFLEVNVRTYVINENNERGIWFYSLDASNYVDVLLARFLYKLPYVYAHIEMQQTHEHFSFWIKRREPSVFKFRHEKLFYKAKEATLDHFLIERYRLYAADREGDIYYADVAHHPYDLAVAHAESYDARLLRQDNLLLDLQPEPCHLVYSPGIDVKVNALKPMKY